MHENLHSRLAQIADEQDNRTENKEPQIKLDIVLLRGESITGCEIVDGSNGLDDQSVDLGSPDRSDIWIVPLSSIVAVRVIYP